MEKFVDKFARLAFIAYVVTVLVSVAGGLLAKQQSEQTVFYAFTVALNYIAIFALIVVYYGESCFY